MPDTSSSEGQRLLAHELTHTIQQNGRVRRSPVAVGGRTSGHLVQREGEIEGGGSALETLITQAETLKLEALAEGVDSAELAKIATKIDTIWTQAQEHVLRATKAKTDTTAAGYKQQ